MRSSHDMAGTMAPSRDGFHNCRARQVYCLDTAYNYIGLYILHPCDGKTIDGSTDRCCIAIVTNERALLSGSD